MCRRGCKRVSFSPDPKTNDEPINHPTHNGLSSPRLAHPEAWRVLQRIGAEFAKTLRFIFSAKKKKKKKKSVNAKTTPSSLSCSSSTSSICLMKKSKSLNESESHRAEAIEDCIEFLNSSSSSFYRSNSISTSLAKRV